MSQRGWKVLKGAACYRSPDFFIIFFFLEIACPDDEFNWIFIADFNKASRPSKVILLITACHVTTYHHNTVTKCQCWWNFKNSFFMDGVGSSLGIGMLPPKNLGTIAVSVVQGQKSHQWLLQNPLTFLFPTTHVYKRGNMTEFPHVEFTLQARVCLKTQCKQKGLLGNTLAVLN